MPSSYYKLEIKERVLNKSRGAKSLRKKGLIPGILYYSGEENVNISIDKSIFFHALQSGQRIFEIDQDGEAQYTMIKEIQYHPVTDDVIHIDLMRVRRSEKITISVPIVLVGDAIGVKEGGILSQSITQIEISCFPTDVPEKIEFNVEDMEMNTSKSVADIQLENDDIEIISSGEINIASVAPPAAEEEPDVEELDGDGLEDGEQDEEIVDDSSNKEISDEKTSAESGSDE